MKRLFIGTVVLSAFGGLIPWAFLGRAYLWVNLACMAVLMLCALGFALHRIWKGREG